MEEREAAGGRQGFLALLIGSEGRGHVIETASWFASSSLVG
jgi:hypothetical protein